MDVCLSVTCHYIYENLDLATVLLGVQHFPLTHSSAHIAEATSTLMAEWEITEKVSGMVTDGAHNIVASVNQLHIRHIYCYAHMLNLVVKKSLSQTPELESMHTRARKIVGHFKLSTTAKEKLCAMQTSMGMPQMKLIQEVDTQWNSTFTLFQRVYEQREPLASLSTDIMPFSAEEYEAINQCLAVLRPFNQVTIEL